MIQEKYDTFLMIDGEPVKIKMQKKLKLKMTLRERFNYWREVRRMRKARKGTLKFKWR